MGAWYWRGLVAAAAAIGCSSDPSGGGTGAAGGAAHVGGTPSEGGVGGTGGSAGGIGGAAVAPVFESLTTDITLVTEYPTVITFFAQVSDPQGFEDIAAGKLHQGNISSGLGFFEPTGEPGAYQLELIVDETQGWSPNAYVFFIGTFRDHAGNEAERSKAIQLDIGGCSQEPDYQSCRACYCEADAEACASYTSREYDHLYCGATCSASCSAFCDTVYDGAPNPQLIEGFCAACVPSQADLAAFEQSCVADVPHCFNFLVDMGHCPRKGS